MYCFAVTTTTTTAAATDAIGEAGEAEVAEADTTAEDAAATEVAVEARRGKSEDTSRRPWFDSH